MQKYYKQPIVIFFAKNVENHEFMPWYNSIAMDYKSSFIFVYLDIGKLRSIDAARVMEHVGIDERSNPCVRAFTISSQLEYQKWKPDGSLTRESVLNFLKRLQKNKVPPYKKQESEESIFNKNKNSNIESISATSFGKRIEQSKKPIVLLITGGEELCKNCLEFEEEVQKTQNKIKDIKGLLEYDMLKYDAQLNEVDGWVFETTPELVVIIQNKDPVNYAGIMEEQLITQFLKSALKDYKSLVNSEEL